MLALNCLKNTNTQFIFLKKNKPLIFRFYSLKLDSSKHFAEGWRRMKAKLFPS